MRVPTSRCKTVTKSLFLGSVRLFTGGDVLEPGNYRHVEGTTIEQYISLAAGFTATAKKKDVYFILPNGRVGSE